MRSSSWRRRMRGARGGAVVMVDLASGSSGGGRSRDIEGALGAVEEGRSSGGAEDRRSSAGGGGRVELGAARWVWWISQAGAQAAADLASLKLWLGRERIGRGLLGENEITRRNYARAAKSTVTVDLEERDLNGSLIVAIFCVEDTCSGKTCYCCQTKQPEVCYRSQPECQRHCQRCDTICPPPSAPSSEVRAIGFPLPSPSTSFGNNVTNNSG
ncbi:hypothetical protein ACP4OV_025727 [Aristida adscensionis]